MLALTLRLAITARRKNREIISAACDDYLMYSGYIMMAYHWARMAAISFEKMKTGGEQPYEFYLTKTQTAEFYFEKILPRTQGLADSMTTPSEVMTNMAIENFFIS